jgi:hypothetical protein
MIRSWVEKVVESGFESSDIDNVTESREMKEYSFGVLPVVPVAEALTGSTEEPRG